MKNELAANFYVIALWQRCNEWLAIIPCLKWTAWKLNFSVLVLEKKASWLLLLFYRAASEGWQPPMFKEDTRESPLAQKCYWHRIIPEVGGHFDSCTKQGTPTTRRRTSLVGLKECSQMHKRGWNNIEKKKLLITTNSHSTCGLASSYSSQLRKSSGTRNPNRHGSQKAPLAGGQFCETQKSSSSAPIVDHAEYPITASYGSLGGRLHYSAPVKHRVAWWFSQLVGLYASMIIKITKQSSWYPQNTNQALRSTVQCSATKALLLWNAS